MSLIKHITIVTGTRAEYGLLRPLIEKLVRSKKFATSLVVTGMHLSPEFGYTVTEIEKDGYAIEARLEILLSSDTAGSIAKSMGLGIISFSDYFQSNSTDLLIVLGDRTEILSVCTVAMIYGIPIAHISGGETTEGAYDEAIRHSITKMSYIHFAATEQYAKRIIQLGEDPKRVFNVGAIGIDSIKNLNLLSKKEFENSIGIELAKKNILATFHPATLENDVLQQQFKNLLEVLSGMHDTKIIFTKPNSDKGGRVISSLIDDFTKTNSKRCVSFASLGQTRYLSALKYVDLVIGNSSSGVVEVPFFKIPTINIGDRQKGRLMPDSVISCEPQVSAIKKAIKVAYDPKFRAQIKNVRSPYGDGTASKKIIDILEGLSIHTVKKVFYDLS